MIGANDILTARELAKELKVSKDTVYALVRQNQIPCKYVRRQIRFLGWQILSWLGDVEGEIREFGDVGDEIGGRVNAIDLSSRRLG